MEGHESCGKIEDQEKVVAVSALASERVSPRKTQRGEKGCRDSHSTTGIDKIKTGDGIRCDTACPALRASANADDDRTCSQNRCAKASARSRAAASSASLPAPGEVPGTPTRRISASADGVQSPNNTASITLRESTKTRRGLRRTADHGE